MIKKLLIAGSFLLTLIANAQEINQPSVRILKSNYAGYECSIREVDGVRKTLEAKDEFIGFKENLEKGTLEDYFGLTKEVIDDIERGCLKGPHYVVKEND